MNSVVKDLMWLCAKQIYVCCRKEVIARELALAYTIYTLLFQRERKHTHPRPLLFLSRLYPWRKNVQQFLQMAKPGWAVRPAAVPGKTQLLSSSATTVRQYQRAERRGRLCPSVVIVQHGTGAGWYWIGLVSRNTQQDCPPMLHWGWKAPGGCSCLPVKSSVSRPWTPISRKEALLYEIHCPSLSNKILSWNHIVNGIQVK